MKWYVCYSNRFKICSLLCAATAIDAFTLSIAVFMCLFVVYQTFAQIIIRHRPQTNDTTHWFRANGRQLWNRWKTNVTNENANWIRAQMDDADAHSFFLSIPLIASEWRQLQRVFNSILFICHNFTIYWISAAKSTAMQRKWTRFRCLLPAIW